MDGLVSIADLGSIFPASIFSIPGLCICNFFPVPINLQVVIV